MHQRKKIVPVQGAQQDWFSVMQKTANPILRPVQGKNQDWFQQLQKEYITEQLAKQPKEQGKKKKKFFSWW